MQLSGAFHLGGSQTCGEIENLLQLDGRNVEDRGVTVHIIITTDGWAIDDPTA